MFDALKKLFRREATPARRPLPRNLVRPPADLEPAGWSIDAGDDDLIRSIYSVPEHFASSYSSSLAMSLNVTETFDATTAPFVNSGSAAIVHTGIDRTTTLNASSSPAISKMAAFQKALAAGVGTIDLTSLPHDGQTVTLNALKVVAIKIRNPGTNSGIITATKGAANGYTFFGATWTIPVKPGGEAMVYFGTQGDAVSGTVKTIDLTGTGTEALDVEVLAG